MKINLQSKFLIAVLIIVNVVLVFYFLKSSGSGSISLKNEMGWRTEKYPEIAEVKDRNWDFQKLTQFFKDLATKKGGEYAYHALAVAANSGYITANVDTHLLGHTVGDILYKQKGIEGIKVCTDDIRNACSHSIVVGYLLDNGEESLQNAVTICEEAPGGSGAYTMCVHGLGHGVLGYTEYDMRKAVDLCSKIGTPEYGNQEVGQCIGGVTMEMMAGVHDRAAWLKEVPNYFVENDPLAPCDMGFIPKSSLSFCYIYLTPHLFESAGANLGSPDPKYFNKAMSYCEKIPKEDVSRQTCFGSFGKEYVVLANARNVQSVENMTDDKLKLVEEWCGLGPKDAVSPCLSSALQSLYWGGENDPEVSIRFCNVIEDKKESNNCLRSLIGMVSYYMKNDNASKEAFCRKVSKEWSEECSLKLSTGI